MRARPGAESRELIKLDFPTFERPINAISGNNPLGQSDTWKLLFKNSALVGFMFTSIVDPRAFSSMQNAWRDETNMNRCQSLAAGTLIRVKESD